MNLSAQLLPSLWYGSFNLLLILALLLAWWHLDWRGLKTDPGLQHRFGFALVLLVCIWSLRAGVTDGLGIHFFMVTALHLVFGWQLAISAVVLVLLGLVWIGAEVWQGVGINGWVSGLVPILCTYGLWWWQQRIRLFNPFAFIFLVAFLGAALSVVASGLLMTLIYWGSNTHSLSILIAEYWLFVPLIALPEATLNGILISGLVVFKPEWVKLFDEQKYYGKL